ncbi:TonB-dependent receptor domain-containing protein [Empedobacter tilapiae]|uniref:TonB-dependent receptor domain-containing protein n=1 Tax=Empedobacter tilapiae TaxID=2491114 RepID=UPI0028D0427B|nr:TonB-dependent receptor [Empedobacter tilapiae]
MKTFIQLSFLLCSVIISAQTYELKGEFFENNQAVPYLDISLSNQDTIINLTTNEVGQFSIDTKLDTYQLEVIYFEQVVFQKEIILQQPIDLGRIEIKTSTNLKEVVVDAQKKVMERKIDRFVFNVENSTSAAGGTAMDVLRVTPGLNVAGDAIAISGKNSVMVLIDDKPTYMSQTDLANYLESMSASDISKIEVITTPPAKYEAEGNSGILNIVTKRIKKDSWNANIGGSYQRSLRNTERFNAAYNLQKKKWTIQSSMNIGDRRFLRTWDNELFFTDNRRHSVSYTDYIYKYIGGNLAVDYKLTDKWSVGTKLSINNGKADSENPQQLFFKNNLNQIIKTNRGNSFSNQKTNQILINLFSEYKIDSLGKKISFDADYANYTSPMNRNFSSKEFDNNSNEINNTFFGGKSNLDNRIENLSGKIDVEFPMKTINLSFGARISQTKSNNLIEAFEANENLDYTFDADLSNLFKYKENNEAVYVSGNKKFGEKWQMQAGLRLEATQTEGFSREKNQTNKTDYIKLFPSFYLLHTFNDKTSLGFNYSRRINRPNYESLNPFRMIENEYTYNEGNPFLQPAFTHNFELTFTYKKLDTRVYLSSLRNGVNQASIIDPNTQNNAFIWMNFVDSDEIGVTQSLTFNPTKWWTSTSTFQVSYSSSNVAISTQRFKGWSSSLFTSNDFTLNEKKTLFVNLLYFQNFGETFQNYSLKPYARFNLSFKYLIFDKKLELSLNATDIFKAQEHLSQNNNGVIQKFANVWDMQSIRIGINYKFGSNKLSVKNRETGNSDEVNRM